MTDKLGTYHRKRRFDETPEPSGVPARRAGAKKTAVAYGMAVP